MLIPIIKKELFDLLLSTKFAISFAVCSVLILMAFATGARQFAVSTDAYESGKTENLRALEGRTDWYIENFQVFLKPQPLAMLISGVSNDIGKTISVRERGELQNRGSFFNDQVLFAVFRLMDLEFIFKFVLPLFAMLLGYDAVNGEKERGTLRLAFSNAVPRATWITGKLIGNYTALVLPLLIPILLGCLIWNVLGIPISNGEWARFAVICAGGFLYFGLFLAASILFSTLTHRSSNSFIGLLTTWVVMVAFVPAASVIIAGRTVPVPSADEIAIEKARVQSQLWNETQKAMSSFTGNPKPDVDPQAMIQEFQKFMADQSKERQKKQDEFNERQNERRSNAQKQQEKVALTVARISPTSSFSLLVDEVAGTSLTMRERFLDQAKAYQQTYSDFLKEKRGGEEGIGGGGFRMVIRMDGNQAEAPKPINPAEIPSFNYSDGNWKSYLQAGMGDLALLSLWNMLLLAASVVAFLKYDLR